MDVASKILNGPGAESDSDEYGPYQKSGEAAQRGDFADEPESQSDIQTEAAASKSQTLGASGQAPSVHPFPKQLRPLVDCGAVSEAELDAIQGSAFVTFEGNESERDQIPLAWLLPDFYEQIRKRADKPRGGQVCGKIIGGDDLERYFGFVVPAPEGVAAPSAETERMDRLENLIADMAEKGGLLASPEQTRAQHLKQALRELKEEEKIRNEIREHHESKLPREGTIDPDGPDDAEEEATHFLEKFSDTLDSLAAVADTKAGSKAMDMLGSAYQKFFGGDATGGSSE